MLPLYNQAHGTTESLHSLMTTEALRRSKTTKTLPDVPMRELNVDTNVSHIPSRMPMIQR